MTFIAHGIANGFGALDVSAGSRMKLHDFGVLKILREVINKTVRWNDWSIWQLAHV